MAENVESEPPRRRILKRLDLVALELLDEAAALTDQVVVVRPPFRDLVQRLAGPEVARGRDARFLQQLDRAVDRRQAHARMLAPRLRQQILQRDVARGAQERVDDRLALLRRLQPLALQVRSPGALGILPAARAPDRAAAVLAQAECRHLIEHPMEGRCSRDGWRPASNASIASASSRRVTRLSSFQESSM